MRQGRFFLIPVPLKKVEETQDIDAVLPASVGDIAKKLTHFVAENAKSARAFLKALPSATPLQQIDIRELNAHTTAEALDALLAPLRAGIDLGLMSEAGCPAVADPGAQLVALAHREGFFVQPLIGPSSILLALMGSGLSGQNFAFHGYLPIKEDQRLAKIRQLEKESRQENRTQIFIETPYRNRQMLQSLVAACAPNTRLCVATDLSLASERIRTLLVSEWRRHEWPDIDRKPSVFLLQA